MRQRSLLAALTLMLTSGVHAKNGDTFNGTYVLQGVGSGKLMMLELNGRLLVNADELARGLSRVGWLDASFASGLRTGLVPLTSHGGNRFVDPDAFAKRFGLTLRADHSTRRLLISKGVAGSTAGTKAALPAPTAPSTSRPNVVQGTRQLDGENALPGQTFTVGKSSPLNFTLIRAEFSVGRVVIGEKVYAPKQDQKLLVLHYSVQNPQPREVRYHWSDLSFTAVDAQDRNHTFVQTVARQGAREALSTSLKPAQKVNVTTVILVPAAGPVRKLLVSREAGAPILRYDLRGQVAPLVAPFADASDPSGSTPLAQVRVPAGTFLPLGWLDVRLDEVGFTAEPLAGRAPATGKRYLTAVFTLKNMGPRDTRYHWGDFKPGLKDAEGEHLGYNEQMLRASRDEKANGMLPSGEETRVRFFWELPGNVGADTLYLNDRQGLTYAFVVKDAR